MTRVKPTSVAKCPECGRLISLRFPVHVCETVEEEKKRKRKEALKAAVKKRKVAK